MPAIDNLLKRIGFVRLSRYGLVLTPEGRIMTLRQDILNDGMDGKIVGWLDRDLAATELAKWEPVRPAAVRAAASRVAIPPPIPSLVPPPVPAFVSPPIPVSLVPPPPAPRPVIPVVASAVEPEEDEWEWEIALARARAAAEDAEIAVRAMVAAPPVRRTRQDTVPPPPVSEPRKTQPMPSLAESISDEWPKTEPLGAIDYEDYTNPMTEVVRVVRAAQVPAPAPKPVPMPKATSPSQPIVRTYARAESPVTIIPVPKLPRITQMQFSALEPVVSPRRMPKGTPAPQLAITPPPPIRAGADETKPGIVLPPVARAITLPQIPGLKRASRG